jgi:Flp pilus assembly protein TadD
MVFPVYPFSITASSRLKPELQATCLGAVAALAFVLAPNSARCADPPSVNQAKPRFEDFVGADACAKCHPEQYRLWKSSTHGLAGGEPNETKLIAKFDGKPLLFRDGVVIPRLNAQGLPVFVIEQEGQPKVEIEVDAVVGGGHMYGGGTQSFFKKFADGTVRFLPFDFIRQEGLWFVQRRADLTWAPISPALSLQTDLANWPPRRVLGTLTEFSNCQNCHGSQIAARYDQALHHFETRYQTLRIDCESCHGPARHHLDIVSQPGFEKLADIGMPSLATLSKDQSLLVCFQCHATKDVMREDPYLPGESLETYFSLKLPHFENTYTVDGRIRSFGYQGNHLYSDCYRNGSMSCVDCHDPHSQQYRDAFGTPLTGRFDNGQCTSCHASKALASEQHSHHQPNSPGNRCTACHMPFLQHRGVGSRLKYGRADHTIPIPRPAFDQQLGIENACQQCHQDQDLSWQMAAVNKWYGELKPHPPMVANLLRARGVTNANVAAQLLLVPTERHPMAQAAGLVTYIKQFLRPDAEAGDVIEKLKGFAATDDWDLKALALLALQLGSDAQPEIRSLLLAQRQHLNDATQAVLDRWAIAAGYVGDSYAARGDQANAIRCFRKSLEVKPDSVVSLSHLALAYLNSGDTENAISALRSAIAVQPFKAPLHFQLALIYQRLQQIPQAIDALETGLRYAPQDPIAQRMRQDLRGR